MSQGVTRVVQMVNINSDLVPTFTYRLCGGSAQQRNNSDFPFSTHTEATQFSFSPYVPGTLGAAVSLLELGMSASE